MLKINNAAITDAKKQLRQAMRAKRERLAQNGTQAAHDVSLHVMLALPHLQLPQGSIISAYIALKDELDPTPLMQALHRSGYRLALPCVVAPATPLAFRTYTPGDTLHHDHGAMKLIQPVATAPIVDPDCLLVPLLAFDRAGYRLGYGAGFYDRTLAALRCHKPILAIGLGYAGQEVDHVPRDAHDARLDKVATNTEFLSP